VDNSPDAGPKLVDNPVGMPHPTPISFGLPEGAGGTDAGPVSD